MRIISGKYKGRIIRLPKGMRPTQDKVRKAVFDILGDIEGLSFLELFAGSGAVGLEALSRGAKEAVFVENNSGCRKALENNFTYLLPGTYCLLPLDALVAVKKLAGEKKQFNIIFLDPPYYKEKFPRLPASRINSGSGLAAANPYNSLAKKTLQTLSLYDILAPVGLIVVQHFKKDILPDTQGELTLFKQSTYGDTLLSFYRKRES